MTTAAEQILAKLSVQDFDIAELVRDALTDKAIERMNDMRQGVAIQHFNNEAITEPYTPHDTSKSASKKKQSSSTMGKQLKPTFESYSDKNPKVDLFVDGTYHSSTNWSKTGKEAVSKFKEKYPEHADKKVTFSIDKK